ncbi:GNAT family N-acetyltransferase [Alistipes sp. An66]|uniref:GNAT family N-acetyltransferase n=1 Tax=Alistipes sp. An66 TaxID=1965650 RepID=UPI000B3ABDB6|nr:GNAT family N-acetyltransferase [Alistipes sp. An66]
MMLSGGAVRLRAVEPEDAELLYEWENDPAVWAVSGTTEPFSREQIQRFIERQASGGDLLRTGQLRLMIEVPEPAGAAETGAAETGAAETGAAETGVAETGVAETGVAETGAAETGAAETEAEPGMTDEAKAANPNRTSRMFRTVGTIDLFEYDVLHGRAGIGILIYDRSDRGRGYAADAVETLCRYARERLRMHQLWCNVGAENEASLRLFRGLGFREIGRKRDWLWTPDGYGDEIMLQKILE